MQKTMVMISEDDARPWTMDHRPWTTTIKPYSNLTIPCNEL